MSTSLSFSGLIPTGEGTKDFGLPCSPLPHTPPFPENYCCLSILFGQIVRVRPSSKCEASFSWEKHYAVCVLSRLPGTGLISSSSFPESSGSRRLCWTKPGLISSCVHIISETQDRPKRSHSQSPACRPRYNPFPLAPGIKKSFSPSSEPSRPSSRRKSEADHRRSQRPDQSQPQQHPEVLRSL
jgi:hypothetical protein